MGSTGRNDRRGPWSYHGEPTGSNSYTSISSGTVSTGYTTSANSQLSWMSMEAARHFQEMDMEDTVSMEMEAVMDLEFSQSPKETASGKNMEQIKIMEAARHFQEMEMKDTVSMEMEAVMDLEFVQSPKETASGEKIQEMEADRQIQKMEMKTLDFVPSPKETAHEKKIKQIKTLAREFFGAPSGKCSAEGGDLSVLERWFTELGVGWVLHVPDGTPAGEFELALDASRWIPALTEIADTFSLTLRFLPGHVSAGGEKLATESKEENMAEHLQLASFTQQAMLKMLTFVDFIVAPNLTRQVFITDSVSVPAHTHRHHIYDKLHNLLRVHEAMSKLAWIGIQFVSSSAEVATILREIVEVLSAREDKVGEAIWSALEEIRTRLLESPEDVQGSSGTQTPQGSLDIDKATRSVMVYVMFLQHNYWLLTPVVSKAANLGKYVPGFGAVQPVTSLAMEIISSLQEKLANKSEASPPDQGHRFLFLLNNSSFIADQLHDTPYFPKSYKEDLAGKAEDYMKSYIQVSWALVLSCLINPTPNCLGKNYSPLPKFESEFQKMYNTQKLWKVPDPKLRNRLRRAIINELIPCYTRYLADYYENAPQKFSPSDLQEMLQELFEG